MADMNAPLPLLPAHIEKRPFGLLLHAEHHQNANEPRCTQAAAGLCFGFAKRSVICADFTCELTSAWPSRALSRDDIKLSAAAFRPGRHFRLSRHRDPAPVGVCHIVPVESSLLHCSGIDELPKEASDGLL